MYGLERIQRWFKPINKPDTTPVINNELTFITDFIKTNYSVNDIKYPFVTDKVKLIFTEADLRYIKDKPDLARIGLGVRISMCLLNPEALHTHFTIFKVTEITEEEVITSVLPNGGELVYSLSIIVRFVLEKKKDSNTTIH